MPEEFSNERKSNDWDIVKAVTEFLGLREKQQPMEFKPLIQLDLAKVRDMEAQQLRSGMVDAAAGAARPAERPSLRLTGDAQISSNGTLELRYDDPNFDKKLQESNPRSLTITGVPQGDVLRHWFDGNGFFFWFDKNPEARHYYSQSLKEICINGVRQDVDAQRKIVADNFMANNTQEFTKLGLSGYTGTTDVMTYFRNLSKLSRNVLDYQERFLREGARVSADPLYHVFLSDVLVTQALQPIIDSFDPVSGRTQFDSPETIKKMDEAIEAARQAQRMSRDYISSSGRSEPPAMMAYPLAPLLLYAHNPYYAFASTLYQAQRREVAYTFLKELLKSGALNGIEILPPALPPR